MCLVGPRQIPSIRQTEISKCPAQGFQVHTGPLSSGGGALCTRRQNRNGKSFQSYSIQFTLLFLFIIRS